MLLFMGWYITEIGAQILSSISERCAFSGIFLA